MSEEVVPGVHQLKIPMGNNPLGGLNAYLLMGANGHVLVDVGWNTPQAFDALVSQLRELDVVFGDIRLVVITHVHPDHYGMAGRLRHDYGTKFAFHLWEKALIETRYVHYDELLIKMGRFLSHHGVPQDILSDTTMASLSTKGFVTIAWPDEILYGGETIRVGGLSLEVIWTPGHSPGHVCLYEPSKGLLLAGDHVLPHVTPNIGYHLQSGSNPLGEYLTSLQQMKKLSVRKVLPAHEEVFTSLATRIDEIVAHHGERNRLVLELLSQEPLTAYTTASRLTWRSDAEGFVSLSSQQRRMAIMETLAHLEYLRMEGSVQKFKYRNLELYRIA